MALPTRLRWMPPRSLFALVILCSTALPAVAAWNVTYRNALTLSAGSVPGITELSGVTYLGPAGGLHRFGAVQDDGSGLVRFDVSVSANGTLLSATAVNELNLENFLLTDDHEGVAFTDSNRNSVFVSEERTPDVSEYSLATGERIRSVALPGVFGNVRSNLGFEALTRSPGGGTMWTANEESLAIDGPVSTQSVGTTVRLLRIDDDGTNFSVGPQFAYQVDPIHGPGADRGGVPDLVMLPDDTLLVLERSRANSATPVVRNRIYQVDTSGATDVSGAPYTSGLVGKDYTLAAKSLLFSGPVGTAAGVNMEGLTLGPQLENGNWLLLGVADNGGSGGNPIMTFELSLTGCGLAGDYNCNGSIGEEDYKLWRNTFGTTLATAADGNGNKIVDAADYTIWRDGLEESLGAGAATDLPAIPEPGTAMLFTLGIALTVGRARRLAPTTPTRH